MLSMTTLRKLLVQRMLTTVQNLTGFVVKSIMIMISHFVIFEVERLLSKLKLILHLGVIIYLHGFCVAVLTNLLTL